MNILFFDNFETLDAFGPLEIFGKIEEFDIHHISFSGNMITSSHGTKVYTSLFEDIGGDFALLIPGGQGTRSLVNDQFFIENLKKMAESSKYCLSVCTGSALLAKTDLLNGKSATTNKRVYGWVVGQNKSVKWVQDARWVVDSKFYTSSGISAGMDMALGFVQDMLGRKRAEDVARQIEYLWHDDSKNDPFAAYYKVL